MRRLLIPAALGWLASLPLASPPAAAPIPRAGARAAAAAPVFDTSHNCMACHNGMTTPSGEDISFGIAWRATMMANSARDPYWLAAVRREILDHPSAAHEIEDECSVCHMPMARTLAVANGQPPQLFAHVAGGTAPSTEARLALDGVSCALCHQITPDRFGSPESFTGGYVVNTSGPPTGRPVFGPYPVDPGRARLMHSATGFLPAEGTHLRQSEMCATCHTLYTKALDAGGKVIGRLPEQVPYLEWRHSAYRSERSCQSCHMPLVAEPTPIASVMGEPREGVARHSFRGGNFFMLRMLNRYRVELGVEALPQELDAAVNATLDHLGTQSASLAVEGAERVADRLRFEAVVANLAGHKLPTAYPSRRAWLHVVVRDGAGSTVFESGAPRSDGAIHGNDNDEDGSRFEPHHAEITDAGQVQVYEAIMRDGAGAPTTGLLTGVGYVKDNRLLPRGFDKRTAQPDVAVHGAAADDSDFIAPVDRVQYVVDVGGSQGPFQIEAVLRYQPIGYRWAENLKPYDAAEPRRFVGYFRSMSAASSAILARDTSSVR